MSKPLSAVNIFAVVLGIFLVIEGFWGMFDPLVFGIFSTNILHASIHLILGFTGIYTGLRNHARKFCLYVGMLLLAVGILYFIPGADALIVRFFNVNNAVAYLNIIVGILCLLFAFLTPKPAPLHHEGKQHK
ncbi:MAG: hypothetical protein JWQ27_287 [Ferruginibacter sp.]|nr:hypothetical protein [Ferruginibacter sp.]